MKRILSIVRQSLFWFLLLLGVDAFWAVILWIADVAAFKVLVPTVILSSILLFAAVLFVSYRKNQVRKQMFAELLGDPSVCSEKRLLNVCGAEEGESIALLASILRERQGEIERMSASLRDYEEYVESWAHDAKTPLSLLTMILDNRNDELSPPMQAKLNYVRSHLQKDVTQMLYYARLKSSTKDYRFEDVKVNDCAEEVLDDFAPLLEEKGFEIRNGLTDEKVYTDRRGLSFMLDQIVANAVKYAGTHPILSISMVDGVLSISDNGIGAKEYDLPYIFQKGFTGDSTDPQKKATGMGLYLTKKMADDLGLRLNAVSERGRGFTMEIIFPK